MIRPSEWLERLSVADLSPEAKTLLRHMLTHAKENGGYGVLVPDAYLIAATGYHPKKIIKHLAEAFKKGWLHARVYAYGTTPQTSTAYILSIPTDKQAARKPRVARKAKVEMTLEEWEAIHGLLSIEPLMGWVSQKTFCPVLVRELLQEFRIDQQSKGKLYADFRATFQNYVNKGYLSKKPDQLLLVNSPHAPKVGAKGKEQRYGVSI